jgi:hypothetical protein
MVVSKILMRMYRSCQSILEQIIRISIVSIFFWRHLPIIDLLAVIIGVAGIEFLASCFHLKCGIAYANN